MEKLPKKNKKENKLSLEQEYVNLLDLYQYKVREFKKLLDKVPEGVIDQKSLVAVDNERHQIHLKLIELGKRVGKDENDILVDILRKDKTLEAYGLPEFSVLKEGDIIKASEWDYSDYNFNIEPGLNLPSFELPRNMEEGEESIIGRKEIMIVFAVVPVNQYEDLDPEDYKERVERATALAEETGGRFFEEVDAGNHTAFAKILGVIISSKNLDKVAAIIRNNPEKYRLGRNFYSGEIKKTMESLDRINSVIGQTTGIRGNLERLPEPISGMEALKGKKILMVDNDSDVFRLFIPDLLVVTDWKAEFLFHRDQDIKELADEIMKSKADVVLMYYSFGAVGTKVAKLLIERGSIGSIVGFSVSYAADAEFKKIGALGAIHKYTHSPEMSIRALARGISAHVKS